jgi:hypothetical protein
MARGERVHCAVADFTMLPNWHDFASLPLANWLRDTSVLVATSSPDNRSRINSGAGVEREDRIHRAPTKRKTSNKKAWFHPLYGGEFLPEVSGLPYAPQQACSCRWMRCF